MQSTSALSATHEIQFGDSLGGKVPSSFSAALRWWISQHCDIPFTVRQMDIGVQKDTRSCGLFAVNAVAHLVNPGQHELLHQQDVLLACLNHMCEVMFVHLEQMVCPCQNYWRKRGVNTDVRVFLECIRYLPKLRISILL